MEIPQYRIDRIATEEEIHQMVKNIFRRMLFFPVRKTGRQAYTEAREKISALNDTS